MENCGNSHCGACNFPHFSCDTRQKRLLWEKFVVWENFWFPLPARLFISQAPAMQKWSESKNLVLNFLYFSRFFRFFHSLPLAPDPGKEKRVGPMGRAESVIYVARNNIIFHCINLSLEAGVGWLLVAHLAAFTKPFFKSLLQ